MGDGRGSRSPGRRPRHPTPFAIAAFNAGHFRVEGAIPSTVWRRARNAIAAMLRCGASGRFSVAVVWGIGRAGVPRPRRTWQPWSIGPGRLWLVRRQAAHGVARVGRRSRSSTGTWFIVRSETRYLKCSFALTPKTISHLAAGSKASTLLAGSILNAGPYAGRPSDRIVEQPTYGEVRRR